jgi:DNA-directed RNA polymerase specialized sigma subunit
VVSVPRSVISRLNERERLIFKYYYQDRVLQSEIPETVEGRNGISCSAIDVARAIERIDKMLSVNKRWHLLAALRANRPALSLDDSDEDGTPLIENLISDDDAPSEWSSDRVARLNRAIELLDPEDQLLVQLRFEHEMRAHQIARVMQFENHRYVYTRLRTIVNQLRRELMADEVEH